MTIVFYIDSKIFLLYLGNAPIGKGGDPKAQAHRQKQESEAVPLI